MQQQNRNIEHPDLTKMRDDQLENEVHYLIQHITTTIQNIENGVVLVSSGYDYKTQMNIAPTWKYAEDLKLQVQRHEAVIEEILYRAEMMR